MKRYASVWKDAGKLTGIVCGATLLGELFVRLGFPETNIVVIYILAVLLVARLTHGYLYGMLASVVSLLCFNYFFTAPYHTFDVNDPSYMVTFGIMLVTASVTSALTTRAKLLTKEATERGLENQTLYMLSSRLSDAADAEAVVRTASQSVSSLMQANAGCIYVGTQAEQCCIWQHGDRQVRRSVPDT